MKLNDASAVASPFAAEASRSLVRVETHGAITQLALCRGDKANALSAELVDALTQSLANVLASIEDDALDAATIVIRSEGKNFCAGFDLSFIEQESEAELIARLEALERLLQALYHAPCATIALVQGGAFGAGFDLAMACDYRLAARDARFRMPSWKMGIAIGTRRLASRIGRERAFEFLRSAPVLDAATAHSMKFVTEVADPVAWPRRIDEIANEAGLMPSRGYSQLKRMLLADTRNEDMTDLIASLRASPLKPRMERYIEAR
jgi:enoyl-CoA hydratase/carnithine racemase